MAQYRKKPIVIDAIQWNGIGFSLPFPTFIMRGLSKDTHEEGCITRDGDCLSIKTLEGVMKASPNDYIICGVKGEVYPCKPDIFEATYELVNASI